MDLQQLNFTHLRRGRAFRVEGRVFPEVSGSLVIEHRGVVSKWKDDKGYGFITPDGGGEDVFFHISSVRGSQVVRPVEGSAVTYCVAHTGRAVDVRVDGTVWARYSPARLSPSWLVVAAFFGFLGLLCRYGGISMWPIGVYAGVSAATFFVYQEDKANARIGAWRTPEIYLHMLELMGGWPGGLAAQGQIRHKNRKTQYQVVFWTIVMMHLVGLVWCSARHWQPLSDTYGNRGLPQELSPYSPDWNDTSKRRDTTNRSQGPPPYVPGWNATSRRPATTSRPQKLSTPSSARNETPKRRDTTNRPQNLSPYSPGWNATPKRPNTTGGPQRNAHPIPPGIVIEVLPRR